MSIACIGISCLDDTFPMNRGEVGWINLAGGGTICFCGDRLPLHLQCVRKKNRTQAWERYGKARTGLIRNVSPLPLRLFIDHHLAAQHRLTLPRCRSSTISSNIPSTPPLFCCRNRRHFMHRPPKILFKEKLKQPVCRLTLPTIVRFFRLFVTHFS